MSERMTSSAQDASTGELMARLSEQTSTLIRDEMRLAQAEMSAKAKKAGMGLGMFGAGGLFALLGSGAAVATIILALALVLPPWAAALIVTVVLFIIAGIVALLGKKQVEQAKPSPERTMANVKQDVQTVKENAKS
ncbi:MAG TPA: phage holin family protein [Ornithinimicrobium sp.]|uniref:phage holin family protein n=1 Tax=Ornithinimicrobium sp. TaxID=1977084 RepID=UPI002B48425E|nr:phage holin family protein [Ornithinimicrobium sp.]HKJ12256.1 phage holin family protein [Ornithinimicrobium sp.]